MPTFAKDGGFDVVTGGAGFIGSHISRGLLNQGRAVCIIDNFSTGREGNLADLQREASGRLEMFREDVRSVEALKRLFEGAHTVYHQAAIPSVQRSVENPLESNGANLEGTLSVLLVAREAGVRKVVFASSSSVYGDSETLPKQEEMVPDPLSPYAVTKYGGELYCRVFSRIYGLPTIGLRYFNVFGPFQDPQSEYAAVIPRFICRMLSGQRPIIYGDGEQSRDFTYVSNVVSANLLAARSSASGITVNIACGRRFTLNQLVRELNEILGTQLEPIYEPARPGDVRHSQADIDAARSLIGFQPEISFREGLDRTVDWFRQQMAASAREKGKLPWI